MCDYSREGSFKVGDRVEIHPAHDLWMRGARYGVVVSPPFANAGILVLMDIHKRKLTRFLAHDLRHVGGGAK